MTSHGGRIGHTIPRAYFERNCDWPKPLRYQHIRNLGMNRRWTTIVMILSFLLVGMLVANAVCAVWWNISARVELGRITLNWYSANNRTTGWVRIGESTRWSWKFSHVYYMIEKTPPGISPDRRVCIDTSEESRFDVLGIRYYQNTSTYAAYYLSTPAFVLPWPFVGLGLWALIRVRRSSQLASRPAFPVVSKTDL